MIKSFLQKMFGKYLESKAALYDGTPTEGKAWWKSKTLLASVYIGLRGVYDGTSAIMSMAGKPPLPQFPTAIDGLVGTILGVVIAKGRVEASRPIVIDEKTSPKDQQG